MAKAFTFELKGADRLLADLTKLPKEMKTRISGEIEATMNDINAEQIARLTPHTDTGFLRMATAGVRKISEIGFSIVSDKEYAPYVEFGTGALVNVPAGLESYAMQFKGKGIKQVNLPARPYFFTPFFERREKLINDIKDILKRL